MGLAGAGPARVGLARVGLGRAGVAVPTVHQLRFQLDHALARDAVHAGLNVGGLMDGLRERGLRPVSLRSRVPQGERQVYLKRPDLGRRLDGESAGALVAEGSEVVFVLADGLSALAVERHALPLLDALLPLLAGWRVGVACVVTEARVAIGDEIGGLLGAGATVMLIGERPGLSAPDSLGVYLTWQPRMGRSDAERNCVSNIREGGLGYAEAAGRVRDYLEGARRLGLSGVGLKEMSGKALAEAGELELRGLDEQAGEPEDGR